MLVLVSATGILIFGAQGARVAAATITVLNTNDSGAGSLRAAILTASANDTINFSLPANSTISLTSGELLITTNLTITGPGASQLTVQRSTVGGTPSFRVFHITVASNVTITGLTVANGSSGIGNGAGIFNENNATLVVTDSVISDNASTGGNGAGLYNNGTATVTNCTFSGNSTTAGNGAGLYNDNIATVADCTFNSNSTTDGNGAGFYNDFTLTVTNCTSIGNSTVAGNGAGFYNDDSATVSDTTVTGNSTANGNGAGFYNDFTANLSRCTIDGNFTTTGGNGGGLFNNDTTTLTNCTVSGNHTGGGVGGDGGGVDSDGTLTVVNCTISGNSTAGSGNGGGIAMDFGTVFFKNTIVALNTAAGSGPDLFGEFTTQGFNFIGKSDGSSGFFNGMDGDHAGTIAAPLDPLLGPLQDNGGRTHTQALLAGSGAIDQGAAATDPVTSAAITTDQRGFTRPVDRAGVANASGGNGSDIGAFEGQVPTQAVNISSRANVLTGDKVLIGGFILTGTTPKKVAIRAIGPSLANATPPVPGALADPVLELHEPDGTVITNNDWMTNSANDQATITMNGLDKFNGLAISNLESIIIATLAPTGSDALFGSEAQPNAGPSGSGNYTAIVRGNGGGTGLGLVEVYDIDGTTTSQLANISTRGLVQTGNNVMIGGFIVGGNTGGGATVLVRALGPSLTALGVSGVLADPTLELHDGNGAIIASNDNWQDTQKDAIMATTIPPTNAAESAIVDFLVPGNYTAIVRGFSGTTGVALLEVYNLN